MHADPIPTGPGADTVPAYPRPVPQDEHHLPKFTVRQLGEDQWEATADYEITDVMAALECRAVVRAETLPDLVLLATVQSVYAGMVRAAEQNTAVPARKDPA